jgi:hypothetical protein
MPAARHCPCGQQKAEPTKDVPTKDVLRMDVPTRCGLPRSRSVWPCGCFPTIAQASGHVSESPDG